MGDFNLQAFDLLGELDTLRVSQWLSLVIDVANVQYFAHELNYWLRFVEGSCRHVNV